MITLMRQLSSCLGVAEAKTSGSRLPLRSVEVALRPACTLRVLICEILPLGVLRNQHFVIHRWRSHDLVIDRFYLIGRLLVFFWLPGQRETNRFDLAALDHAEEIARLASAIDHPRH